jgi:hypothetical protein
LLSQRGIDILQFGYVSLLTLELLGQKDELLVLFELRRNTLRERW